MSENYTQALILSPTRELCVQISGDLNDYAKYINGIKILPIYGGASIETQINAARKGVQIIVATPGRLIDLINRRVINLNKVSKIVLDEADEMLNMGFTDSINAILAELPENRTTLLFSATMPPEIAAISRKYMNNPIEITIGFKNAGAENVKHIFYTVHARDKYPALKRIADYNPNIYGIVFCRTRKETQEIADKLIQDGYNAESLHGDLSQSQRDYVMQKFRVRNIRLLVATDVAARGLDVDDLTHIINYTMPDEPEVYTHRSGRTGRAGKAGISIAIINLKEKHLIKLIEKKIKKQFIQGNVPTGREICEKQLFSMIDKMEKVEIENSQIDSYLPVIYRKLEWIEKEELIKRFVALEFNRFLDYYHNAPELNTPDEKSVSQHLEYSSKRNNQYTNSSTSYTRLFINLGKMDGLYPKNLIELINENTKGKMIPLGKIDLMRNFSFFEVEKGYAHTLIENLNGADFNNKKVSIEIAQEKKEDSFRRNEDSGKVKKAEYKSSSHQFQGSEFNKERKRK